jgi:hypothetical protein
LVVPTCLVWKVNLFREMGVVHQTTYSFSYFLFTCCFIYSFYSWYKIKVMLYPVKHLNHSFIKITVTYSPSSLSYVTAFSLDC